MIANELVQVGKGTSMPPFLLFGEDDPQQAALLAVACKRAGLRPSQFHISGGGLELLAYLEQAEPPAPQLPRPSRVITDFRMPLFDGIRVLLWIRGNPHYSALPVTIISSQIEPQIQTRAEFMGATEVRQKPTDVRELAELIRGWAFAEIAIQHEATARSRKQS